ncbi:MAG: recombination regulator RecX [Burkholderiales bacterium]
MHELKSKALYFLARREYSYKELFTKLKKYCENQAEIHQVLEEMQHKGWLSEERYISSYLRSKSHRYGLLRIRQALMQKTGNSDLVDEVLEQNPIDEYSAALGLWQKKFGIVATDSKELARQIRFLHNKGFSFAIIKQVIAAASD